MRKEIKEKRNIREKHFLNKDGTIEAIIYNDDVHFLKNGIYEDIDNTLIRKNKKFINRGNDFKVLFDEYSSEELLTILKDNLSFKIGLENTNNAVCDKYIYDMFDEIDDDIHNIDNINYYNIYDHIHLNYEVLPNKVKENIIIESIEGIKDNLVFTYDTDLNLKLENDKSITVSKNGEFCFKIEAPYMIDNRGNYNNNIYYEIKENKLILNLDVAWLNNCHYPVIIDPTITTRSSDGLQDTYISSKYPDTNFNGRDYLLAGVFDDEIGRTLIKFDLPVIGTGSSIIESKIHLVGYPELYISHNVYSTNVINAHVVTSDWNETTATWNNINNQYEPLIEDYSYYAFSRREFGNEFEAVLNNYNITRTVKKWYAGLKNYGIMFKSKNEIHIEGDYEGKFFSKNNTVQGYDPKPFLSVTYRNQNGLESYMTYQEKGLSNGLIYINNYNGNLVGSFNLGNTVGGPLPTSLNLFYNTNDVILNRNYGFGKGMKLNLYQTISYTTIEDEVLYEYVDEDGTIHYFRKDLENQDDLKYYDEDGLSLTLEVFTNECIIKDKDLNKMLFNKHGNKYYLKEIENTKGDKVEIIYENDRIIKIIDSNLEEINITYGEDIIINSNKTVTLKFNQNKLISITNEDGTIDIGYNNYEIINYIKDINNLKTSFEYFDMIPYRIKKISEYGIDSGLGKFLEFNYGHQVTTINDNKGRINSYTFNYQGNTVSTTDLKQAEDVKRGYGNTYGYASYYNLKNKYTGQDKMMKHINNLIYNSSFEKDLLYFSSNEDLNISFSYDYKTTGNRSLKLSNLGSAFMNKEVVANMYYTFSVYMKNNVAVKLKLETNNDVKEINILPNNSFERSEITIYNNSNNLKISFILENEGIVYIDDIQLEEGKVANYYNLIDNSDFSLGLAGFRKDYVSDYEINEAIIDNGLSVPDEIVTLSSGVKAYKMICDSQKFRFLTKNFDFSGKAGDRYYVTFWYKNRGTAIPADPFMHKTNQFYGQFYYPNSGGDAMFEIILNPSNEEWQFCSGYIVAIDDYNNLILNISSAENINYLYIANITMIKDIYFETFKYDEFGNITGFYDNSKNKTEFKYDNNNQLIQMTNPQGSNFNYEYDNIVTNRILSGISPTGITNQIKYDEFGNPIVTKINNVTENLIETGDYYIRAKGTNNYLKLNPLTKKLEMSSDTCSHDKFKVEVLNDRLKILPPLDVNVYLFNYNLFTNLDFIFIKQDNNSYILKNADKYLTINAFGLELKTEEDLNNQQFYFEKTSKLFMLNEAEYSVDGKFLTSTTDTLFNKISYDINTDNGLINSITDSLGNLTYYNYNTKEELINITKDDILVNYEYNNKLLSKIICNNKEYSFNYDEFFKIKSIYINNNKLIENSYEVNNGNLLSSIYGNTDTISYEYDDFDRLIKINKMNDQIYYYYDNFGNLKRIDSLDNIYLYYYDLANRLIEYKVNNFKLKYDYNKLNNVITKKQVLDNLEFMYNYEYNVEEAILKITNDDLVINYYYDELGRLINKNINGYTITYNYLTNGYRTSTLINSYLDNFNNYEYKYDKLGNITKIYKNNILTNHYYYDIYNQLIKEESLTNILEYNYDLNGNILNRKIYDLNNNLIKEDNYQYDNLNWQDQLTKYNNINITYDAIGNPLTIDNINLSWINGRQLNSFNDNNLNVTYKYNKDGIREEKIVNGNIYKYYLENNKIIFCQNNENMIYFMYDNSSIIGFKYNGLNYYYIKNIQDDVIGIMNSDLEQIVNYEYDSYGNILSIKDENNNEITNLNHIGHINPFRYRSYYYDSETKLYYLNSRYYNPEWGRFINSDSLVSTGQGIFSHNMYIYTENNYTSRIDVHGHLWFQVIGAATGALINVAFNTIYNVANGKKWDDGFWGAVVGGAVSGLLMTTPIGIAKAAIPAYSGAFAESAVNELFNENGFSLSTIVTDTLIDGTIGLGLGNFTDIYKINKSWFRPKKFATSLVGNYTRKLTINNITGTVASSTMDNLLDLKQRIDELQKRIVQTDENIAKIDKILSNYSNGGGGYSSFGGGNGSFGGGFGGGAR